VFDRAQLVHECGIRWWHRLYGHILCARRYANGMRRDIHKISVF
jgi:hypothetical protein